MLNAKVSFDLDTDAWVCLNQCSRWQNNTRAKTRANCWPLGWHHTSFEGVKSQNSMDCNVACSARQEGIR